MVAVVRLHKFLCLFMLKGPSIFSFQCHVRTFSYSSHHLRFRSFCFHTRPFGGVVGGVLWKHCHSLRSLQWHLLLCRSHNQILAPKGCSLKTRERSLYSHGLLCISPRMEHLNMFKIFPYKLW